jgi:hypothetical protein
MSGPDIEYVAKIVIAIALVVKYLLISERILSIAILLSINLMACLFGLYFYEEHGNPGYIVIALVAVFLILYFMVRLVRDRS